MADDQLGIVHWRNKITGQTGHGEPLPRYVADEAVKHGNIEYPFIEHWVESAPSAKAEV